MSATTKSRKPSQKEIEKQEAVEHLRKVLKPGDKVYGIVRTVSRSGMSRTIDFYTFQQRGTVCVYPGCGEAIGYHLHSSADDCPGCKAPRDHHEYRPGEPTGPIDRVYLSGWIGTALDYRRDNSGALKVQGCGMDMVHHVVYNVSRTLFPGGFGIACEHCGERPGTPELAALMAKGMHVQISHCPKSLDSGHGFWGRNGDRSGWDEDGGYALKHESL